MRLRRRQITRAMEGGDKMLISLGKQYLRQIGTSWAVQHLASRASRC